MIVENKRGPRSLSSTTHAGNIKLCKLINYYFISCHGHLKILFTDLPVRLFSFWRDLSLHKVWSVTVDKSTKGQAIPPRLRHVRDLHTRVSFQLDLTPFLQALDACEGHDLDQ